MKAAFFFDSKALGRSWVHNINEQAISGTDGSVLQVLSSLLKNNLDEILFCAKVH